MANIVRRRGEDRGEMAAPRGSGVAGWDPFRTMQELLRWDPFGERDLLRAGGPGIFGFVPAFDVKETEDSYVLRGDMPGLREEDVEIALTGNTLAIRGRREEEKRDERDRYHAVERMSGEFSRSFVLPEGTDPDGVSADLKNGVLTITVPKRPDVQPRRIELGGRKSGNGGDVKK
jgi:HSP20 family protein